MRVIKFRFWDKGEGAWMVDGRSETNIYDFAFKSDMNWKFIGKKEALERVAVMQFTGLHDCKGKEIYEGDILRTESGIIRLSDGKETGKISIKLSVVEWNTDGWGYYHAKSIQNNSCSVGFKTKGIAILASFSEVIGNIYENPELLEVKA